MTSREPFPASWTVRRARDAYLAENGFTVEAYDDKWTDASFLGIRFAVPNTKRHRRAIMVHDLHHVATCYGTDLAGEAEVSAWELRGGLRAVGVYVGSIVLAAAFMGVFVAPRRTLGAWRAARDGKNLFDTRLDYESLLDMTVGELRVMLGIAGGGLADRPRGVHAYAPASI